MPVRVSIRVTCGDVIGSLTLPMYFHPSHLSEWCTGYDRKQKIHATCDCVDFLQSEESNFGAPLAETGVSWPSLNDSRDQPKKKRTNSMGGGNGKRPDTPSSSGQPSNQQNGNGVGGSQTPAGRKGKGSRGVPLKLEDTGQLYRQGSQGSDHGQRGRRHSADYSGMSRSRDNRFASAPLPSWLTQDSTISCI